MTGTNRKRIMQQKLVTVPASEIVHKGLSGPPKDNQSILHIADELLKWSEDPTVMAYNKFALDRAWNPYRFSRLAEKSEYFADAQTIVKERIALRIEEQSRKGKSDEKIEIAWVKEFLPKYSQEYKEQRTALITAKIESHSKNQATIIQVIAEPIPNIEIVDE